MDIFEKAFGKFSSWTRKKEKTAKQEFAVTFEGESTSLIALCCLSSFDPHILVRDGQGIGYVTPDVIYLPEVINFFKDKKLNRDIFLHKALVAGTILKHNISYTAKNLDVQTRAREIWNSREKIISKLQNDLPNYKMFYQELIDQLPPNELPPQTKKTEELPLNDLMLWCQLMMPGESQTLEIEGDHTARQKDQESQGTEVQGKNSPEAEIISLEKEREKENPVAHSFEKLETADEYRGGYKTTDTSDEIMQHSNALDELKLKKVTREGGVAQSVYKASTQDFFKQVILKSKTPRFIHFKYLPEWDYKTGQLLKDACRLYPLADDFDHSAIDQADNQGEFMAKLYEKYNSEIKFWEGRLWSMVNQRKNADGQLDGHEINVDAFIRYVSDMKVNGQGNPRLYVKSLLQKREFTSLILLDQSLSTDSWVSNKRVLDLELESVALAGLLLKEMKDPVLVAGTWSETKNHCYFKTYKDFHAPWSHFIDQVDQIQPQGYTRLGPSIRHASDLLVKTGYKNKLLILLTDGKPTDFDRYEGRYGIEDIRQAILTCQQHGVIVKALAIDKEAKHYFPRLFGNRDYQILSDPSQLPERLFKIYAELTMKTH